MTSSRKIPASLLRYGGFALSVGGTRVVGVLITSITFPFLVRRLGVEMYGLWSYVIAVCAFFDLIANPGLTSYATQQVAARRHAAAELIPDILALRLLATVAAIVVLLLVSHFETRTDVRSLFRWFGAGSLCISLLAADHLLTSLEMFHTRSLLSIVQQSLYAAGVLLLVKGPRDVIWVPMSILGSVLITNVAGWVVLWRAGFRIPLALTPPRWRAILTPSFHYAGGSVMSTIYHRAGHVFVRWFLGEHALGLYAAAVRFVDLLRNFVNVALSVVMPRIAKAAQSEAVLRRVANALVSALLVVSIPLILGTLATAHLVVPWVMGAAYSEAVRPVRWMSPFLFTAPLATLLSGTILYAMGKYRAYFVSASVGALTAVLLALVLVPTAGLAGACIAFTLAEGAVALAAYCQLPHDLRDLWKNSIVVVAGASALLMCAAVRLANSYSSRPLLVVATGAIVYLISAGIMGRKRLVQQFGGTR
jgi:O-antigen/teichoic acid export membrane protein